MSRRGRRSGWSAQALPGIRREIVRAMNASAAYHSNLVAGREKGGLSDYVLTTMSQAAVYDEQVASQIVAADLFWVSGDMALAALDASQDVPSIDLADAPCPIGLMAFADPLPAWGTFVGGSLTLRGRDHTIEHTEPVPVDAIAWRTHRDRIEVHLLCKAGRLPAPMYPTEPPLVSFTRLHVPLPFSFEEPAGLIDSNGRSVEGSADWLGAAAFLAAAWTMMQQPTVALRRSIDTRGKGGRGGVVSPTEDTSRRVTVIDLRPARYVRDDGEEGADSGRKLKTRHLVRGHWTNQPYGKGREKRRKQWIASYIRGPEGAPWSGSETVYAWRR